MSSWEKNIPWKRRFQSNMRNFIIKRIKTPVEMFMRQRGFLTHELFRHVLVQTNYTCTRRCHFCHYGQESPPTIFDMPESLFFSIINQLANISYTGRLGLFEMNEPLTDKRFEHFLAYARSRLPYAWIFISSNGDLLDTQKAKNLFKHGLNYIYLSSYDNRALRRNEALINSLADTIPFKKKVLHLNRTYQENWSSRAGNVKQYYKKPVNGPCDMVYRVLYVKPQGTVHSCYNDFYDKNIMGNVNKDKLTNIWFSDKFQRLRKSLLTGDRKNASTLCGNCDYPGWGNLPTIPLSWRWKNIKKRLL